jgi:hypothetical protein
MVRMARPNPYADRYNSAPTMRPARWMAISSV